MDLMGPIKNIIIDNKYTLTILNDHSRFGWILSMESQFKTFYHFYNWFNKIKNQFNK